MSVFCGGDGDPAARTAAADEGPGARSGGRAGRRGRASRSCRWRRARDERRARTILHRKRRRVHRAGDRGRGFAPARSRRRRDRRRGELRDRAAAGDALSNRSRSPPGAASCAACDSPAASSVLASADLLSLAAMEPDDALRQTPGFTLFRRSSSRSANPTTQGVTLRGLSASGASRTLVLAGGVPLNDPFGGWVYWGRIPQAAIERIEVVRGGLSDLYGADAAGGVINIIPWRRRARRHAARSRAARSRPAASRCSARRRATASA